MKKKILVTILLIIFLLNFICINITVAAETKSNEEMLQEFYEGIDISEEQNESVIMKLEKDGTLVIEGNGRIEDDIIDRDYYFDIDYLIFRKEDFKEIKESLIGTLQKIEIKEGIENIPFLWLYESFDLSNIKSIEIPGSVEEVGKFAFMEFQNLEEIKVASNNSEYCSVDGVLFNKSKTELIRYPGGKKDTDYTIPNTVTKIHPGAFALNNNLENLIIPNSVTDIGPIAFMYDTKLENVTIPNTITEICKETFAFDSNLKNVVIPEGVDTIERGAFYGCSNIQSIRILSSRVNIDADAFVGFKDLHELYIPKDFQGAIDEYAFAGGMTIIIPENTSSIEIPEILKRVLDKEDSLYAEDEIELFGCKIAENKQNLEFENLNTITAQWLGISLGIPEEQLESEESKKILQDVKWKGAFIQLKCITISIVESGSITYDYISYSDIDLNDVNYYNYRNVMSIIMAGQNPHTHLDLVIGAWINYDITSTLHLEEGATILNNNGEKTHTFTENGEFTYKYKTKDGIEKTVTAKATNIDKRTPRVMTVTRNTDEQGNITLTVYAEDNESGLKREYSEEEKEWTFLNKKEFEYTVENNEKRKIVEVTDLAKNTAKRTIDVETCAIIGDVNEDGDIDFKDILEINKYRLNKIDKTKISEAKLVSIDVNEDREIDFKDMLKINKFRLGKIENF